MKTIREIAGEIGVSKQAVYKRYKSKLYKSMLPYVRTNGGTIYIMEQGESIIKADFLRESAYNGAHTEYTAETVILILQKELEMAHKQIEELTAILKMREEKGRVKPRRTKFNAAPKEGAELWKSSPIERIANLKQEELKAFAVSAPPQEK